MYLTKVPQEIGRVGQAGVIEAVGDRGVWCPHGESGEDILLVAAALREQVEKMYPVFGDGTQSDGSFRDLARAAIRSLGKC
jgi:hypothetical protein